MYVSRLAIRYGCQYGRFTASRIAFSIVCILGFAYLFLISDLLFETKKLQLSPQIRRLLALQSSNESNGTCQVPLLDPFDPTILSYINIPKPLVCQPIQPQFATFSGGYLQFDLDLLSSATCSYRNFSHDDGVGDFEAKYGDTKAVVTDEDGRFKVEQEMIELECSAKSVLQRQMYKMHFAQVVPQETSRLYKDVKIEPSSVERPSVIMIGLDSMSRSNFIRQMNKTYSTMQAMGFIDMLGHVKIGDNTYPNWVAILMGKHGVTSKEFPAEITEEWGITFDEFDMIWRNFSKEGYATLFAEDRPDISTFNFHGELLGFKQQPTDHYFRTYWLAAFYSLVSRRSPPYCYDGQAKHKIQLDYLTSFLEAYENKRKFAFWWSTELSHDFLNLVGQSDAEYADFLTKNERLLNDSIVIVFSDHGQRYDKIRETVVGRLEARLPYLSIRIPPAIDKRYPHLKAILRTNSEKMTTQFDLNESLNALAKGDITSVTRSTSIPSDSLRSRSIFHSLPPRTCRQANVPDDFCPCADEKQIPAGDAVEATKVLLQSINSKLSRANSDGNSITKVGFICTPLDLANVTYASVRLPNRRLLAEQEASRDLKAGFEIRYRVMFVAKPPSNALIEGVVVQDAASGSWQASGEFERNNMYGNTSHCVNDATLKKICYCVMKSQSKIFP